MPELSGMIQEFLEGSIKTKGRTPVVNALNVTENGTYTPESGVDGFNPVVVNVPDVPPVIDSISIFANGEYEVSEGIDGYSPIIVDVPQKIETTLNVTENGTYTPAEGYTYNGAIVNVPQVGRLIVNKYPIVSNRTLQPVPCTLVQGKYYSIFYYDDYLFPRQNYVLGCASFSRISTGSAVDSFYMNYNNISKDWYCTDTSLYLNTKFDNDAIYCYVSVIELDDSVISPLIPS